LSKTNKEIDELTEFFVRTYKVRALLIIEYNLDLFKKTLNRPYIIGIFAFHSYDLLGLKRKHFIKKFKYKKQKYIFYEISEFINRLDDNDINILIAALMGKRTRFSSLNLDWFHDLDIEQFLSKRLNNNSILPSKTSNFDLEELISLYLFVIYLNTKTGLEKLTMANFLTFVNSIVDIELRPYIKYVQGIQDLKIIDFIQIKQTFVKKIERLSATFNNLPTIPLNIKKIEEQLVQTRN